MHRFGRVAKKLSLELEEEMEIYAENYGEMTPEEWAAGEWFSEGPDDGRETWIER